MSNRSSPYKGHKRQKSSISSSSYHHQFHPPASSSQQQQLASVQHQQPIPQSAPATFPHEPAFNYSFPLPVSSSTSYSRSSFDYTFPVSSRSSEQNNEQPVSPLKRSASQQDIYHSIPYHHVPPLFNYPPPQLNGDIDHTFKFPENVAGQRPPTRHHQKNNLSISSHLTLFNLDESRMPQDLVSNLATVDGSNINSFLLSVLEKTNTPYLLDDFYNLLYNEKTISNSHARLDKAIITSPNDTTNIFESVLNYFKHQNTKTNINYHELLRSFLAIKILKDILIQLDLNEIDEPQNFSIPRLSIYKVYYIICQKLISIYPSSSNSVSEQQKIILGQSKLGKLIKLVYPKLLIKRLGSRGESKYNYLGVVWNDLIVHGDIKSLCEDHELNDLNEIFNNENNPFLYKKSRKNSIKIKKEETPINNVVIEKPNLSFVKPFLYYPIEKFTVGEPDWFTSLLQSTYEITPQIQKSTIQDFLFNTDNLNPNNLLHNVTTMIKSLTGDKIDLKLYQILLLELTPFLLLTKSSTDINFLKNLRINLLNLINLLNNEIESIQFSSTNSTIFVICLRKLLNLNDLLITFIKLINKSNNRTAMLYDIDNFLQENEPIVKEESITLFDFNFKNSILSNDLVYTLVGFNFDPSIKQEIKQSISMKFINSEIDILDHFFKIDLKQFLNTTTSNSNESTLSSSELVKIGELFNLIDTKLLSNKLILKYPILIYNSFITFILNDILKYIFLKQQEMEKNESFGVWYVFNCLVQEYIALVGEIAGLNDCIENSE